MRHIETQIQKEKREQNRNKYIGLFLLGIMVLSTAGYALLSFTSTEQPPSDPSSADAFGRFPLSTNGQTIYFTYQQKDVNNISININTTLGDYRGNTLYVSSENQGILYELSSTIGRFVSKLQEACYGQCEKNLPEKNCSQPFIVMKESEEIFQVTQENQCIFVQGDLKSLDAFLYKIFKGN